MPWIVDTRALYYNKALCAQAGVDPKKDFATWVGFKLALRKFKKIDVGGKRILPLGIPMSNWDIIHNLSWWIWGAGGGFVGGAVGESAINSPDTIVGLDYYISLFREGLVSTEADKVDAVAAAEMLRKGEIATTIAFPIPSLPEDRFGIAAVPAGPRAHSHSSAAVPLAFSNHPSTPRKPSLCSSSCPARRPRSTTQT
jgi:ABC-type glycerol-3-phosphate transport system substrate-binding protein